MPLHLGTPAQFEELRALLHRAEYTEAAISQRLDIPSFANFGSVRPGTRLTEKLATPFDALSWLFMECEPAATAELIPVLGTDAIDLMRDLGLLKPDPADAARVVSTVGLCPTRGVYLANDRGGDDNITSVLVKFEKYRE